MLHGNHNRQLPHTPPFLTNGNDTTLDNGNLIIKKVPSSSFEQILHVSYAYWTMHHLDI